MIQIWDLVDGKWQCSASWRVSVEADVLSYL